MCISPIFIENPNYRPTKFRSGDNAPAYGRFLKDCTNRYIAVPCGKCCECENSKQAKIVQRCLNESLDHYVFYSTLTYNNESLPKQVLNGIDFPYADLSDFTKMIKRLRNVDFLKGRDFKYLVTSEFGGDRHRPHFHWLLFVQKLPTDTTATPINLESYLWSTVKNEWRRNYGSKRNPKYKPLFTYRKVWKKGHWNTNYDFHYVNPNPPGLPPNNGLNVSYYVTKYCLKFDEFTNFYYCKFREAFEAEYGDLIDVRSTPDLPLDTDVVDDEIVPIQFRKLWNLVRPKIVLSKNLGYHSDYQKFYINDCVSRSLRVGDSCAHYINNATGKKHPLSGYFAKKVLTPSQLVEFFSHRESSDILTPDDVATYVHINPNADRLQAKHLDRKDKIRDKNILLFDD